MFNCCNFPYFSINKVNHESYERNYNTPGYKLQVTFDDGVADVIDLKNLLKRAFFGN